MKLLILFGVSVVLALGMVLANPGPVCASQSGCGLPPLKPLPPLGCKDLVARCQCVETADGDLNCDWVWDCIPSS